MAVIDRVRELATPLLADLGLELYDVEHAGGIVRVTVERPGGVDLDALAVATRVLSRELDHVDPIPGHYTLEVTSPGLERTLRTPLHFQRAVGATVSVRTHPGVEPRRAQGILRAADDEGITVFVTEGPEAGEQHLRYADIERARTVFIWEAAPKPGGPKSGRSRAERSPIAKEAGAS